MLTDQEQAAEDERIGDALVSAATIRLRTTPLTRREYVDGHDEPTAYQGVSEMGGEPPLRPWEAKQASSESIIGRLVRGVREPPPFVGLMEASRVAQERVKELMARIPPEAWATYERMKARGTRAELEPGEGPERGVWRGVLADVDRGVVTRAEVAKMFGGPTEINAEQEPRPVLSKVLSTPESRSFWEHIETTAAEVATWPPWKRHRVGSVGCEDDEPSVGDVADAVERSK